MVAPGRILLGPQRHRPIVADALASLGVRGDGPIAYVTAGWEEREGEDGELQSHLAHDSVNLRLHERAEDVFRRDRDFFAAMHARYDRLRRMRDLYRLRLDHALEAARELMRMPEDDELVEEEEHAALAAVRRLDEHHLEATREFQRAFEEEHRPEQREAVASHRRQLDEILEGASALCIAGGHVGILLNRLRLFGIAAWVAKLPTVAWSAGAMALSERVVLFHDSPPWGRVNAEVLEAGLGLARRVVPLPHAKERLLLDDPLRVSLFAQRFDPELCCALDDGSRIEETDGGWRGAPGTMRLCLDGTVAEVERWS